MNHAPHSITPVSAQAAIEEQFFLGLRLNRGVDLNRVFGESQSREAGSGRVEVDGWQSAIEQCQHDGLLEQRGTTVWLTTRGRLLSNEVFARFLIDETKVGSGHVKPR
jgi:oxygen-independent coproporphyrinogen-3 oxidase